MGNRFFDLRVAFTSPSTGDTGQIAVGSRIGPSFKLPAETNIADGDEPLFVCQQGDDWMEVVLSWDEGSGAFDVLEVRRSWIDQTAGATRMDLTSGSEWRCVYPDPDDFKKLFLRTDIDQSALLTSARRAQALANLGLDSLDLTLAQQQMLLSDALNQAVFLAGETADRLFADSFDALTYVDTGAATNLDSGSAGLLKPANVAGTLISQATGTAIGNMTSNGGLAAAFDGTTSQALSACATLASSNGYVGKNYSASPKQIGSVTVNGSSDSGMDGTGAASNITLTLYGKNGGAPGSATDGTPLATDTFVDGNGNTKSLTSSDQTTAWDYVWVRVASSISGTVGVAEVRFYGPGLPGDLAVTSTALTAASAPSSAKMTVRVNELDALTENTDLIFSMSRDGGSTWTAFVMERKYTGPSGLAVWQSAELDISGQPSGTSVKWKAAGANSKAFELHEVRLYWK